MGITKDFFTQPVVIPITLIRNEPQEDGTISQSNVRLLFTLRREKHAEMTQAAIASVLGTGTMAEIKLQQFCNLLTVEPSGLDDFPGDERELRERAKEYFSGDNFESLVRTIMLFYEQSTTPLEAYRSV